MKIDANKIEHKTGIKAFYYDIADSTNTQAKKIIFSQPSPFLVLAGSQTEGRGRMGRRFESDGRGIYMSFVFKSHRPQNTVSVTTAAAAAVVKALEAHSVGTYGIKWVNDILLKEKKVCGILTEGVSLKDEHFVIVGIGINIGAYKFEGELKDIAASIELLSPPEEFISEIISQLYDFSIDPENRDYMKLYREKFILQGKDITASIDGNLVEGMALGVTDDGGLLFKEYGSDKTRVILSGEVSVRNKNN